MAKKLHRIAEALQVKGKTPYWLAKESGITYTSIHGYVKGSVEPSLSNLHKISRALGVPGKELINF